jgi:NAD(P)H-hydrate epimerase
MANPMQLRPLSRSEVRALDARAADELGLPPLLLMENAGRGAAEGLRRRAGERARVLIVCGPGNNGGDGAVAARHLDAWGFPVRVVWLARAEQLRGDAAFQYAILAKSGIEQHACPDPPDPARLAAWLAEADWVVDGLFGTGLTRAIEGLFATWIETINGSGKPVLALDLPSGLDADTGLPLGVTIRATATASFVALKLGFAQPGAESFTGEVFVVDIGLPRRLLEPFLIPPTRE